MFHKEMPGADMKMLTIASIFLTIPFFFYARDIAASLRVIAGRERPEGTA
ncbi:MAG TPA: hypothetical protein PK728_06485 [Bacillota bacterium]|nr:hypothetical protein [Bacillota bacterium]